MIFYRDITYSLLWIHILKLYGILSMPFEPLHFHWSVKNIYSNASLFKDILYNYILIQSLLNIIPVYYNYNI